MQDTMLFSHRFRIPGLMLATAGLILGVLYLAVDLRFELPVLAIVSSYMETSFFTVFRTNFADEAIFLLLLPGLFMMAFSREKEEAAWLGEVRLKALTIMLIADTAFLLFSVLFIYGSGFLALIMLHTVLPLTLYLLIFNILKARRKHSSQ